MNAKYAKEIVKQISFLKGDPEAQHSKEDDLLYALVDAVKEDRVFDALMIAEAALEIREMDFDRWCA